MKLIDTYKSIILQEYSNKIIKTLTKKFQKEDILLSDTEILQYITKFDRIKNNLPADKRDITKYSWNDLKSTVISNTKKKPKNISKKFKDVEPIYNQNNLKIFLANSKDACINYGIGYNFCISSRGEKNNYFDYRFDKFGKENNTIYFVIDEDRTKKEKKMRMMDLRFGDKPKFKDPYHILVILVNKDSIEDNEYSVSNANNDGEQYMSWAEIAKIQPKLERLQYLFVPVTPIPKEIEDIKIKEKYIKKLYDLNKNTGSILRDGGVLGVSNFDDYSMNKIKSFLNDTHNESEYKFYGENGDLLFDLISGKAPGYEEEEYVEGMKDYIKKFKFRDVAKVTKQRLQLTNGEKYYMNKVLEIFDEYEKEKKEAHM